MPRDTALRTTYVGKSDSREFQAGIGQWRFFCKMPCPRWSSRHNDCTAGGFVTKVAIAWKCEWLPDCPLYGTPKGGRTLNRTFALPLHMASSKTRPCARYRLGLSYQHPANSCNILEVVRALGSRLLSCVIYSSVVTKQMSQRLTPCIGWGRA